MADALEFVEVVRYGLRQMRLSHGLSIKDVANFLNRDYSEMNAEKYRCYEQGKCNSGIEHIERLCELYGYDFLDLCDGKMTKLLSSPKQLKKYEKDLPAIAEINKIALNILEMQELLVQYP